MPALFRSRISALLILLLLPAARAQAPLSRRAAECRARVAPLPVGGELTVNMRDGTQYCGNLRSIEAETFSLREVDLRSVVTVRYEEVQRVRKGYGRPGFGGRRVYPRTNRIAALAILGGLLVVVFAAVLADKS